MGIRTARIFRSTRFHIIAVTLLLGLPSGLLGSATLKSHTAAQDKRFATAFAVVNKWIARGAFPGAVLAVGQHGSLLALKGFGHTEYSLGSPPMTADEIFDLASVSKVIGTTTVAAILYQRHKLALDEPVVTYLPHFAETAGHNQVTVRELLTHSSGIAAPPLFWLHASDKRGILQQVYTVPLASIPGTHFVYRDTNFILMGEIVERLSGRPLNVFLRQNVFVPLRMTSTEYRPSRNLLPRIAPTEVDRRLRHRLVHGEVHDENCYIMGGACGHAGLFSDAGDLAVYAQMMLNDGSYGHAHILKKSTVELFTTRQNLPPGSTRALGWDTPGPNCFVGSLASPHAVFHIGFTGTSVYIDFDRDAFIILLTNRVYPARNNNKISLAGPEIYTAVLRLLNERGATAKE